ncbi:hypothetical protein IW261DRAFT_1428036 [Armillaria novae-zelandiae]|uniref:Uncharacterized protein n=1 Tax=Armillaria novae-zelandiae TaxID=153914 RepID=A0AA39TY05_9AGAR|nr:hypothetical protein IW261DRAFT_1428036 [Armillaria novae-zelandiae]
MSSTTNSIPTLNSLVARVDVLIKSPPAADTDFLAITAFFNEAATIKFISGLVIQFHFTDQWLSVFRVETTRLQAATSGNYHLTGDQILVLSTTKSILGSPKSTSGSSTAVTLKDTSITPDRSGSSSPTNIFS